MEELVLCLFNYGKPFKVESNASYYTIGEVLMWDGHLVAYESWKLNGIELQYMVQENKNVEA